MWMGTKIDYANLGVNALSQLNKSSFSKDLND